ncbi:UNVERIFIED_CONTAM: hypothetical protein Sradi_2910800 [Sesamum radiatum]|uniref:Retrotransposon Copia-like N-terminal domain-containing protein n=1 Tax=Sesamum radiatum TaxID=300843 RepID=A0AAW2RY54_SESRA
MRLESSDHAGMILVLAVLTGSNSLAWSRVVQRALATKMKLDFIDGTTIRPTGNSKEFKRWNHIDSMVTTWILNSISKEWVEAFMYVNFARELWLELQARSMTIGALPPPKRGRGQGRGHAHGRGPPSSPLAVGADAPSTPTTGACILVAADPCRLPHAAGSSSIQAPNRPWDAPPPSVPPLSPASQRHYISLRDATYVRPRFSHGNPCYSQRRLSASLGEHIANPTGTPVLLVSKFKGYSKSLVLRTSSNHSPISFHTLGRRRHSNMGT